MPNFEFKCDTCGEVVERLFLSSLPAPYRFLHQGWDPEKGCTGIMVRLLGQHAFILK